MRRRSLPQLVIPVPCHVDWNTMTRIDTDGVARFCDSCERPVYDSASLTRDELLELIARHEGRRLPCIQLHRRPDGTIVTRDCFAPLVRVGRFLWVNVVLAAVAFWVSALAMRSVARAIRQEIRAAGEWSGQTTADDFIGGMVSVVVREDEPPFPDPARLAPLPPGPPRPHAIPAFDWRPPLPAVDGAEALHKIEADEGILNPPKRKPRYLSPDWMRR